MGMAPATASIVYPALAMLGSSAISALAAPDGQELQSFEGNTVLDPRNMYSEARSQLNDMTGLLKARANRPVELRSSYVQQPPVYSGGGLPMPIGLTGMDPALADPSLLRLPGLSGVDQGGIVDRSFPPRGGSDDPDAAFDGGEGEDGVRVLGPGEEESGPMSWDAQSPYRSPAPEQGPQRRAIARPSRVANVSEYDDMFDMGAGQSGGGDDLAQGMGAIELLLRSQMVR